MVSWQFEYHLLPGHIIDLVCKWIYFTELTRIFSPEEVSWRISFDTRHLNPAMSLGRYLRTLWGRARTEDGANDRGIGEKASFLNIQGCFATTADIPPAITPHLQLIFVFFVSCPRCVHFSGRFKRFNVAGAASLAVATLCSYVRPRWHCRPGLARFGPLALERYAVFSARQPFVHYNKETSFYKNDKLPCKCRSLRGCMVFAFVDSAMTGKEWNLNIVDDQLGQLGPFESISITRFQ